MRSTRRETPEVTSECGSDVTALTPPEVGNECKRRYGTHECVPQRIFPQNTRY
ncbi:Hypothetical predicted protein [Pelobates cultripes]|uniref:Uncharacterized protein n=1 Tax=Pelobates cultripes TaxID=61616 RepID=A0AAD1T3W2_PELCU|nr:Hypothetical predicted protein [Pelobates cultripes]